MKSQEGFEVLVGFFWAGNVSNPDPCCINPWLWVVYKSNGGGSHPSPLASSVPGAGCGTPALSFPPGAPVWW